MTLINRAEFSLFSSLLSASSHSSALLPVPPGLRLFPAT